MKWWFQFQHSPSVFLYVPVPRVSGGEADEETGPVVPH